MRTGGCRLLLGLLVVLLMLPLGGCSYLFMEPPPPQHARLDSFQCRTSRGTPTLDVVYGVANTVSSVGFFLVATDSEIYDDDRNTAATYLVPSLVAGVLSYASAAYGFAAAAECEAALEQLAARQEQTRHRQAELEQFRLQREHARTRREALESNAPTEPLRPIGPPPVVPPPPAPLSAPPESPTTP